eukprot:m.113445 g.113445  ORF g.113445 m.113445 type:complete len:379 (+) comp21461_c0_seq1:279-1415(+)
MFHRAIAQGWGLAGRRSLSRYVTRKHPHLELNSIASAANQPRSSMAFEEVFSTATVERCLPHSNVDDTVALDAYSESVCGVYEKAAAAVVSISVSRKPPIGSGFFVSSTGLCLTNSVTLPAHNTENNGQFLLTTNDGVEMPATLVGTDPATDCAVLQISNFTGQFGTLQLSTGEGDPRVRVGQLAVSIGNPLGLGGATVSAGVVSQAARTLKSQDGPSIDNVIQSDVALNPGSAGGPMLDTRGKVIGITTTVVPGPAATSFAVAAATIEWVLSDIVQYGEVRRGSIGAAGATRIVPSTLHQLLAPGQKTAVEVVQVQSHGAAEQAGISTADLIIAMNGIPIHSMGDLFRQLSTTSTGTDASITVVRGDVVSNIDVFFA